MWLDVIAGFDKVPCMLNKFLNTQSYGLLGLGLIVVLRKPKLATNMRTGFSVTSLMTHKGNNEYFPVALHGDYLC